MRSAEGQKASMLPGTVNGQSHPDSELAMSLGMGISVGMSSGWFSISIPRIANIAPRTGLGTAHPLADLLLKLVKQLLVLSDPSNVSHDQNEWFAERP